MKKEILLSLICVIVLLAISGCGNPSKNEDVVEYLNNEYPNETFKIISKKYIENVSGSCAKSDDSKYKKSGYKYIVKSTMTNIIFEIKDTYGEKSGGFCGYDMIDDYKKVALEQYLSKFGENKLSMDKYLSYDIAAEYEDFSSIEELVNILINFNDFISGKFPFKNLNSYERDIYVRIYDHYNNGTYRFKSVSIDTETTYENIINQFEKYDWIIVDE